MPRNRSFATLVWFSFLLGTLLAWSSSNASLVLTVTPVSTRTPVLTPKQKRFSLPYSYEESGLWITILEVVPATRQHGILVPKGYLQWTVNFQYENMLNIDWEAPSKSRVGRCAGLTSFKMKTDQGNIYKPRFVGGSPLCFRLKPRAVFTRTELYIFEIREDETPTELWGYDVRPRSGEQLLYIFRLAQ